MSISSSRAIAFALLLGALALVHCRNDSDCVRNSDCDNGLSCDEGHCAAPVGTVPNVTVNDDAGPDASFVQDASIDASAPIDADAGDLDAGDADVDAELDAEASRDADAEADAG